MVVLVVHELVMPIISHQSIHILGIGMCATRISCGSALSRPLHMFAQMLVCPAFDPEYPVSFHGTPNDLEFSQATKAGDACFCEHAISKIQVSGWMQWL